MKRYRKKLAAAVLALAAVLTLACPAAAVELKTGIGIVQAGGLRLRAKANTESTILDNADLGDSVVIIREVGDFYLVDYNLQIGYMAKSYLTFKDRENIELGYANVIEPSVNMRATPSSAGALLAQLPYGTQPYIIGFNCGWYKVTYNDMTGYIRSDLLELTQAPACNSAAVTPSQTVVDEAKKYMGCPYVWGGTSPSVGFDCSGYVQYVFSQLGYKLNRTAGQQMSNGTAVTSLQPGDLVFFANTYYSNEPATHVGIYLGNNEFIHADGGGVIVTSMSESFYASRYVGARRIF